jgi:hypothetical protein
MRQSDTGARVLRAKTNRKNCIQLISHTAGKWEKTIRTVFYVAPLLEMSSHDLFRLGPRARLFDAPDVERAVLTGERADATHVVAIVSKLVAREAVLARVGQRAFRIGERVQVLALPAIGTAPASKEETVITHAGRVCAREAGVFLDVASRLGFRLAAEGL